MSAAEPCRHPRSPQEAGGPRPLPAARPPGREEDPQGVPPWPAADAPPEAAGAAARRQQPAEAARFVWTDEAGRFVYATPPGALPRRTTSRARNTSRPAMSSTLAWTWTARASSLDTTGTAYSS